MHLVFNFELVLIMCYSKQLGSFLVKVSVFVGLFSTSILSITAQERIVGGEAVDINDYPWQVAIIGSEGSGFCGGSIINDSWVLTASHCVDGESSSSLFIRVGTSELYAEGGDVYSVSEIIMHTSYDAVTTEKDVALIKIEGSFSFNENVAPIDLISLEEVAAGALDPGVFATVTGWGSLYTDGPSPSILQMVQIPVVSNATAMHPNGYPEGDITDDMLCAGDMTGGNVDACQGDSGGPMVIRNPDDTQWVLAGIVSWGYGCADPDFPGVYTRVSYFLDWITLHIDPNYGCTDQEALNYELVALYDDGSCDYPIECEELTAVTIEIGGGSYASEVSWELVSYDGGVEVTEICLEDGCHTFNMYDSYGDGWNGNTVTITSLNGEVLLSGTLETGSEGSLSFGLNTIEACGEVMLDILGCIDPLASNYNELVTQDDGSCEYVSACSAYIVMITMMDSYGDGWNGSEYVISSNGSDVVSGTLISGNTATDELCLSEGCYSIIVSDGSYPEEVSWTLSLLSDEIINLIADGTTGESLFSINTSEDCGDITFDILGCTDTSAINYNELASQADGSCEYDTNLPDWDVNITGSNHTIVLNGEAVINLNDMPIEIGDALGVFYTDDNGDLQCAGFTSWTGSTNSIAAQGNDTTTDETDGFTAGESFVWLIWDTSEGVAYTANAEYSAAMTNQGSFVVNGISALEGLSSLLTVSEQLISTAQGWGMFSTYMLADNMDMTEVLAPIYDDLVIAKNNVGLAYLPEWNFNGIGDLEVGQAYQVKLTNANDLTIVGTYMSPEENSIALTAGWNMIGYLRIEPSDAAAVLFDVNATGNLVIAKDYNGQAYLPEWDFNGIGDMLPGQGYQLKINNDDILTYLSNDESYRMLTAEVTNNTPSHFERVAITDNNMTIVIEDAAWDVLPTTGSEVAAYDRAGNMIGSALYTSPVTVLTVWGDDATTNSKDGLVVSEAVSFKVWSNNETNTFEVSKWIDGSSDYNVDAINVASSITTTNINQLLSTSRELVRVINVLGQEVTAPDAFKGEVLFNVYNNGTVEKVIK